MVSLAVVQTETPTEEIVRNLRRVADEIESGARICDRGVMILQDRRSSEVVLVELAESSSLCSEDIGLLQFAVQMRWDKFRGRL